MGLSTTKQEEIYKRAYKQEEFTEITQEKQQLSPLDGTSEQYDVIIALDCRVITGLFYVQGVTYLLS
jgi:hypothetical protein